MISLPNKSEATIADWVELHLAVGQEGISQAEVLSVVESSFGEEPDDAVAAGVWQELEIRATYLSPKPYEIRGLAVFPNLLTPFAGVAYKICLILSIFGSSERKMQDYFEEICCHAINEYIGGISEIFAWRDGNVADKMSALAVRMNEVRGRDPLGADKDCGVDVVSWKPFVDGRSGQMILLTQCASGQNWIGKRPVPQKRWVQYFHWAVNPTVAFAIADFVSPTKWLDQNCELGLFFDRVRLVNLLNDKQNGELEAKLTEWLASWLNDNDT
jgi:hypothetical protein